MRWNCQFVILQFLVGFTLINSCGRSGDQTNELQSVESPLPGMILGRGFDSYHQEPVRGDCFTDLSEQVIQSQPDWGQGSESQLSEYYIRDHEELMTRIGLEAGLKFRNIFYSVLPKFRGLDQFKRSRDALTWLYSIRVTIRDETLSRLGINHLSVQARKLLEEKKFKAFRMLCGTHYVRSVRYGGEFFRIYEVDTQNQDLVRQIRAEIAGNYQILDGHLNLKSGFKKAILESSLKQESLQTGGSFQLEASDPESLRGQIKKWIRTLKEPDIRAFEFELADWQTIFPELEMEQNSTQQQFALMNYYQLYRHNIEALFDIESVLSSETHNIVFSDSHRKDQLRDVKLAIQNQQSQILLSGKKCFAHPGQCHESYQAIEIPDIKKTQSTTLTIGDGKKSILVPAGRSVSLHLNSRPGRSQLRFQSDGQLFCRLRSVGGGQHEKDSFWPCGQSGSRGITTKFDEGSGVLDIKNLNDKDVVMTVHLSHRRNIDWDQHLFFSGLFVVLGGVFVSGWT